MEHVSLMLAGAQIGVTLCSLGLGALGEPAFAHMLEQPLHHIGVHGSLLHAISFIVALSVMVYLHVVIGEMVPKNMALAAADRAALLLVPPLMLIVRLIRPVITGLNWLANSFLGLFNIESATEVASTFTSDEVAGFVEESHREGLLSEDKEQLLSGALRFDERRVQSVLLPMDQVVFVSTKTTPDEIEALVGRTGFSRFPVRTSRGRLTGYVHIKDMLDIEQAERQKPVREVRPLITLKPRDPLRAALTAMQRSGAHLAQVVNNRGRLLGVVALEDVLEELVGEIRDEGRKAPGV